MTGPASLVTSCWQCCPESGWYCSVKGEVLGRQSDRQQDACLTVDYDTCDTLSATSCHRISAATRWSRCQTRREMSTSIHQHICYNNNNNNNNNEWICIARNKNPQMCSRHLNNSVSARMSLLTVFGVADQPANCTRSWPQLATAKIL